MSQPQSSPIVVTAPTDAPCAPIVNGIALGTSKAGFAASGLGNEVTIPSPLVGKRFNIGNWTCLEDGVANVVEAAFLEFTDEAGNMVAVWLLLPQSADTQTDYAEWHRYLSSTYEAQAVVFDYIDSPHSVIGIVRGAAADRVTDIVTSANQGDTTTVLLWPELLKATEAHRAP